MASTRFVTFLLIFLVFLCVWISMYLIQVSHKLDFLALEVHQLQLQVETIGTERDSRLMRMDPGVVASETVQKRDNLDAPRKLDQDNQKQNNQIVVPTIVPPGQGKGTNSTKMELFRMPKIDGINVVAMSLWGVDGRYTNGAVENAQLIKVFFPGWILRIYTEKRNAGAASSPRYPVVPIETLDKLRSMGAEIEYIDPRENHVPAMMWRFLVADDLSVDRFIVRDTDARLSARDAAGVYQWVLSGKPFHCVRDHPSHAAYALSGGLWGGTPSGLRDIFRRPFKEIMFGFKDGYMEDMKFLIDIVWPRVQARAFCSDSVSCDKFLSSYPYPVPRHGYEFVGEVYNAQGLRRPEDTSILRKAGENDRCVPPKE